MSAAGREPIRSYQRLFRPERRLHQIEGRALPFPGGVPLRWLGYAGGALIAVLALASGSGLVDAAFGLGAGGAGAALGGRRAALVAGTAALAGAWVAGHGLALLDWPVRLLILPAGVATVATQATPDGRRAHRFAASWLALRLAPRRRSLGRALPATGNAVLAEAEAWVAPDPHSPLLRRSRLRGGGEVAFASNVTVRRSRLRQSRLLVSSATGRRWGSAIETRRLTLDSGEIAEVRP